MGIDFRFPGGRTRALSLSYDDGLAEDRRLVEILNAHGLRGTFNLNSGALGRPGMVRAEEVAGLYAGHEVAVHTLSHPHLPRLSPAAASAEIREDKEALEDLVGYQVRGMAYPYGEYSDAVAQLLPALGLTYGRTTKYNRRRFGLPADLYRWGVTCYHLDDLAECGRRFLTLSAGREPRLMLVYGHSWELNEAEGWRQIERFAAQIGKARDVWFATNGEIADYLNCLKAVRIAPGGKEAENCSAGAVWLCRAGKVTTLGNGGKMVL